MKKRWSDWIVRCTDSQFFCELCVCQRWMWSICVLLISLWRHLCHRRKKRWVADLYLFVRSWWVQFVCVCEWWCLSVRRAEWLSCTSSLCVNECNDGLFPPQDVLHRWRGVEGSTSLCSCPPLYWTHEGAPEFQEGWHTHFAALQVRQTSCQVVVILTLSPVFLAPICLLGTRAWSVFVWSNLCMFGGSSTHTVLLDWVESKAFHVINSSPLTDWLSAASFSLPKYCIFFLSYHHFHANCSTDLAKCIRHLLLQPCCTRLSSSSHPCSVQLSNTRVNQYSQPFRPFSGKLWNSLHASVFPSLYNLMFFNREISRHANSVPIF